MHDMMIQIESTGAGADERRQERHREYAAAFNAAFAARQRPCKYGFHLKVEGTRDIRHPAPTLAEYIEGIMNSIDLDITNGLIYTWNTGTGWIVTATAKLRSTEQWNEPVVVNPDPPL